MAVLKNRAKMSTSTTGTGTITLGSAEDGYQSFADAGVANADVVRYVIEDGNNFEIGTGTYTATGTTLSRTVSESSNSDAAINLSGSATVFIGATAEDIELSGNMAGDILSNGHAIKLGDRSSSDVNELIMGAGGDFRLYHNGSTGHSLITETGSGNLQIAATNIELKAESGHALLTATYGGSVDLYYNSSKKAETTSSGLQTTGTLNVNGAYTLPTSDGTANQVLTTDGSGAVTFADAGGGDPDLYRDNASSATTPVASGANAVAIGTQAEASGTSSIALGFDAVASAALAFAASDGTASGVSSIAIGESAVAGTASSTIAIGRNTDATGTDALAIGSNAQSTGSKSIAIGQSLASGTESFAAAIVNNTSSYGSQGNGSIAIGTQAKATAEGSVAIGESTTATGTLATALGVGANATAIYSVALGRNADATATRAFSIGYGSTANQSDAYAIGKDAYAGVANQIALGGTTNQVKISGTYTLPTSDGTNGQVLTTDGSGAVTFADAVGGSTGVDFNDNVKARFGTGNDLEIFHDGTYSYIKDDTSAQMRFQNEDFQFSSANGFSSIAKFHQTNGVDLYHNNSKKFETTSSGIQTTGTVNVNGAYTLPTSDGSANQVLTTNGSGVVTFADAGGGDPDLYRDNAVSATTPTASGDNAVAIGSNTEATGDRSMALIDGANAGGLRGFAVGFSATTSGNNSVAIGASAVSSGTQAMSFGALTDATGDYSLALGYTAQAITGSRATAISRAYASGTDSLAAAIGSNSSSYGAAGANSIAMGQNAYSGGSGAVSLGTNSLANGIQSHAFGGTSSGAYSLALGGTASGTSAVCLKGGTASGERSLAVGFRSSATKYGQKAFASGRFAANGDAQGSIFILRAATTDATATVLTADQGAAGSTNQIVAASDTCIMFSGTLVAMQNGAQDQGGWEIKGLLKNDGGTTTLVSSNIQTFDDGNGWTVALSADNTNNALAITCTGEAAHNIRWVANIQTSEVTYA